ncbi:MAG: hypothetical protein ACXAD7_22990 [Candidatus Kariarchaeaceae archaeon]|jgi:hypothetical protein
MKIKSLLFLLFIFIAPNLKSQVGSINGLKFSKALMIEMTSVQSMNYIAVDTILSVKEGSVWMISDAKSFMINRNLIPYDNLAALWLNEQVIHYYKSEFKGPIWLPEGDYRIRIITEKKDEINYVICGYISGIEYFIE